jgi:hypothetical protein
MVAGDIVKNDSALGKARPAHVGMWIGVDVRFVHTEEVEPAWPNWRHVSRGSKADGEPRIACLHSGSGNQSICALDRAVSGGLQQSYALWAQVADGATNASFRDIAPLVTKSPAEQIEAAG